MSGGRCSVGCKAGLPGLKGLVGLSVFRYVPRGKVRSLCPWDLQEDAQDTSASHEQYPGFRLWKFRNRRLQRRAPNPSSFCFWITSSRAYESLIELI